MWIKPPYFSNLVEKGFHILYNLPISQDFGEGHAFWKKSVKDDKNNYQQAREEINMTRAAASDATDGVLSESRIEKIENGSLNARP